MATASAGGTVSCFHGSEEGTSSVIKMHGTHDNQQPVMRGQGTHAMSGSLLVDVFADDEAQHSVTHVLEALIRGAHDVIHGHG